MLFALYCLDHPDSDAVRLQNREKHLNFVQDTDVKVKMAGPLMNDDGRMIGSLLIIEADSMAEAQAFADADPYQKAGLFAKVEVRPFRQVLPKDDD